MIALRQRRERDRTGLMRVEGYEELRLAVSSGFPPETLYFCSSLFGSEEEHEWLRMLSERNVQIVEVSEQVFERMAYRQGPDGWLAVMPTPVTRLEDLDLGKSPLILVAEGVEKPGNLGAMLRTADAAGVDALVSASPVTDLGNPNVVRASKGALFTVPVGEADTARVIQWLQRHRIRVIVADPEANIAYTDADLNGPTAIVVGAEHEGLSALWQEAADIGVRIPMQGRVNSLNVATSAAVLLYEAAHQRNTA